MKKIYGDLRAGGILFALSLFLYFVLIPGQIKVKTGAATLAADFFPRLMAVLIGGCGLLLAATSLYDLCRHKEQAVKERGAGDWKTDYRCFLPHLAFLAAAVLYLVLMRYLGFILSSIPFLAFSLWHFGRRGLVKNLLLAAVYVPIVYLIFSTGFRIRFPAGVFGF